MSEELLKQIIDRLDKMDKDIKEIKTNMATKEDVTEIRQAVLETREDVKGIQERVNENVEDVGYLVRDMYRIKHRKNG